MRFARGSEIISFGADGKTAAILRDLNGDGKNDQTESIKLNTSGVLNLSLQSFDLSGILQNELKTTTTASGTITATISGQGGEFNLENATISLAANASATIFGDNNNIKANNANVNIDGDNTTLTLSAKATGTVLGNNQTIKASAGCIVNVTGEDCAINGSSATIILGNNTEATISGTRNQITANVNDTVNLSGTGHIVNANNADINLATNSKVLINGNHNDIDGGSTVTLDVKGNDNTVDLGTKAKLDINGNGSDVSCGADAKINLTGVGFIVDSSNAELTLDHAQLVIVNGSNNDIDCTNQSMLKAVGTNNDINVIGIKNIVNASSATIEVQKGAEVSVTGDNDTITAKAGSMVKLLGGVNDTIKATEAVISLDRTQVKIDGKADSITIGSGVTLTTLNTTDKNAHNITVTGITNQLNVSAIQNITLQDNAQATVMGANNTINTHENSQLTLQKNAANNTINILETGATINASKARINLASAISAKVNGIYNSIYTAKNDTLSVVGDSNSIHASSENNKITIIGVKETIKGNNLTINIQGDSKGTKIEGNSNSVNYKPTTLSTVTAPIGSAAWFEALRNAGVNQDISIQGTNSSVQVTPPTTTTVVVPLSEPEFIFNANGQFVRNPKSPVTLALQAKADAETQVWRQFLIDNPALANLIATQASLMNIQPSFSSIRLAMDFIFEYIGGDDCVGIDPIILNLSGDLVTTVPVINSPVYFDMENNGQKVQTGWLTAGEGLLVYDPDNQGEVTADADLVAGFADLAQFDSNNDQQIDASDSAWQQLKVWVDYQGIAQFDKSALFTLDQLGISMISLNAVHSNRNDNGNTIVDEGYFTWQNGKTGNIAGVELLYQAASSEQQTERLVAALAAMTSAEGGISSTALNAVPSVMPNLAMSAV